MKQIFLFVLTVWLVAGCNHSNEFKTKTYTDDNGFKYETVSNDPLAARKYILDNGLTVYLSSNTDEPRATCLIGVRAGSSSDPKETTGLAHYFEHMMFKGTARLGTTNWEAESQLIDQIEELYEQHRATNDPVEKRNIYNVIDSISQEAAKYVATNEYDKLMSSIGAKASNAGTSFDYTVYINDVPVNELEKWAKLESERFHGIVLRLFHTELEAVYEEFNMYQDMDSERQFAALMETLFPNHPYGRDVIGYPEDIKNPSMINIKQFYDQFYVPNNMAIAISGDIDFEETIRIVNVYFGDLKPKEIPTREQAPLDPITEVIEKIVEGPEPENVMLAYRLGGVGSDDQPYCDVIDLLLSNSQAGLFDLNLVQQQKVQAAESFYYALKEYGIHGLRGEPLEGQTLDELAALMLAQLDSIKLGLFDEWLIQSVVNDLKLKRIKSEEENNGRAFQLLGNFIDGLSREESLVYFKKLEQISKDAIVAFANENYNDNYVLIRKLQGDNAQLVKVDKPEITAVPVNRDLESEFAIEFNEMTSDDVKPVFVDFDKEIKKSSIQEGCDFYYIQNRTNDLFSLHYIVDIGSWTDLKFENALGYLSFIGTSEFTAADLQKELYKYGLTFDMNTEDERSVISISGLNESLEKGIELMEHILSDAQPDQQAYNDYVDRILKDRADQKAEQRAILSAGMYNYGVYGRNNPNTTIIPEQELKSIDPSELTALIHQMATYKHDVFYYGPTNQNEILELLIEKHQLNKELLDVPTSNEFVQNVADSDKVYVVDFNINQANILLIANGDLFSKEIIPTAHIYNEFYGSGLSSVVFQDIRESKALAYSAYSSYRLAKKENRRNILMGYLSTQSDKLPEATETLVDLLNNMPEAESQYQMACEAIVKKINSERINGENIFWTWKNNTDLGLNYDIRKDQYEAAQTMTIDEFKEFFNTKVKGTHFTYLVLGDQSSLDFKALKTLGKVEELSLEEIFGY